MDSEGCGSFRGVESSRKLSTAKYINLFSRTRKFSALEKSHRFESDKHIICAREKQERGKLFANLVTIAFYSS